MIQDPAHRCLLFVAVNLSTSCKDSDDDDCFFDVDAYVLDQLSKGSVKNAEEGKLSLCLVCKFCLWRERKRDRGKEEKGKLERKRERGRAKRGGGGGREKVGEREKGRGRGRRVRKGG